MTSGWRQVVVPVCRSAAPRPVSLSAGDNSKRPRGASPVLNSAKPVPMARSRSMGCIASAIAPADQTCGSMTVCTAASMRLLWNPCSPARRAVLPRSVFWMTRPLSRPLQIYCRFSCPLTPRPARWAPINSSLRCSVLRRRRARASACCATVRGVRRGWSHCWKSSAMANASVSPTSRLLTWIH